MKPEQIIRDNRAATGSTLRACGIVGVMCLLGLLACGCRTIETFPSLPAAAVAYTPDKADAIEIPGESFLFDTEIDASCAQTLAPKQFALPGYRLAARNLPDATEVESMRVIGRQISENPSPYKSGSYPLVHRVLLKTRSGEYYYTRPFDTRLTASVVPEKYLSLDALVFDSAFGKFDSDGVLRTTPLPPMQVVESGYVATIAVKGGKIAKTIVVPPSFTGLTSLDFSGTDGDDGSYGSGGYDGRCGGNGGNGMWAGTMRDRVEHGDDGDDGDDGDSGENGENGQSGTNGDDADTLQISVSPLASPFFSQPLQKISITTSAGETRIVVLPWGAQFAIEARGGSGGDGGDGGDGGNGGCGGDGGNGGDGSDGADGFDGHVGDRGRSGSNATQSRRGGDGERGGQGGRGEDGTDGGNGGEGGEGGDGGDAGNAGNGGNGANGGRGAQIVVTIYGDTQFAEMVKTSLKFDVRGGEGGRGGDGGAGGGGGEAGNGGLGGEGGEAGDGGAGGRGGQGGRGGKEAIFTDPASHATKKMDGGRDGERGQNGRPGKDGRPGRDGDEGDDGADGTDGRDGRPGKDGRDGADGTVRLVVVPPQ